VMRPALVSLMVTSKKHRGKEAFESSFEDDIAQSSPRFSSAHRVAVRDERTRPET
jgi:hypothetical protein